MEKDNSDHINQLISVFENGSYTSKHIESLLQYFIDIFDEDVTARKAIVTLLRNCKKEILQKPIIEYIQNDAIKEEIKTNLVAVCWESGLDYSNYLPIFTSLLINYGDALAIEASTLISELETIENNKNLVEAIKTIHSTNQEKYSTIRRIIINDTLQHLISINH